MYATSEYETIATKRILWGTETRPAPFLFDLLSISFLLHTIYENVRLLLRECM